MCKRFFMCKRWRKIEVCKHTINNKTVYSKALEPAQTIVLSKRKAAETFSGFTIILLTTNSQSGKRLLIHHQCWRKFFCIKNFLRCFIGMLFC